MKVIDEVRGARSSANDLSDGRMIYEPPRSFHQPLQRAVSYLQTCVDHEKVDRVGSDH